MNTDSDGIAHFCNIVSERTCNKQYQSIISQITNTMIPYNGIALPSKNNLYCLQCPILIDPLKLSVKLVNKLYQENLGNPNISMLILVSNKSDYYELVTILKSLEVKFRNITNQIKVMAIGKKNKIDVTEYDVVIIASHPNSNNDEKSIKSLSKISFSQKQVVIIINKVRKDFDKSYVNKLLKNTCKEYIIIYKNELNLPDKIKKLGIDFRYLVSNFDHIDCKNIYAENFMDLLDRIFTEYDLYFKKMICITETSDIAEFLKKKYNKLKKKYDNPYFLNMQAYTNDNLNTFLDLNNNFAEMVILNKTTNDNIITRSGILFITENDLLNVNISIALQSTDTIFTFNKSGLNTNIINLLDMIITSNSLNLNKNSQFLVIDIYRNLLGKQLYNIYETFYHINKDKEDLEINNLLDCDNEKKEASALEKTFKVQSYANLNELLDNKNIKSDIKITDKKKAKLESMYSITIKDYNYIDRYSITYINDLTNYSKKTSSGNMYNLEYEYLYIPTKSGKITGFKDNESYLKKVDIRTNELKMEVDQIINAENDKKRLKKYSGPVWLGKLKGAESEGSVIAFTNENNDTIEFSKILGTYNFTRNYKRKGWVEKDNKSRKILFLSPVFKHDLLSNFKKDNKKFTRMQKVYFDYD
jgi:hypothetical protein